MMMAKPTRHSLFRELLGDIRRLLGWRIIALGVVGTLTAVTDGIRILMALLIIPFIGIDISPPLQSQLQELFKHLNISYTAFNVASAIGIVFFIQGAIALVLGWYQAGYAAYYAFCWRRDLLKAYSGAKWQFFLNTRHGDLPNALSDETMQLQRAASKLFQLQARLMVIIAFLATALYIDLFASLIIMSFFVTIYVLNRFANAFLFKHSRAISKGNRAVLRKAIEFLDNIKTLKGMGVERQAVRVIMPVLRNVMRRVRLSSFASSAYRVIAEIMAVLSIIIALALIVSYDLSKTPETLIILVPLFFRIQGQSTQAAMLFQQVMSKLGSFEVVSQTLRNARHNEEIKFKKHVPAFMPELFGKGVLFDDVTVCHGDKAVLCDINLTIPVGCITAVVGTSGAGKTTLGDTLLQLHGIEKGRILIGQQCLTDIDLQVWRRSVGYVTQETTLLDTSILENIRLGNQRASFEEVINAAKIANAHEFITSIPYGYDAQIGERGSWLSGGQRQRIALARALVRNPAVLILDEITSALDPESERIVMEAVMSLPKKNRIILIISHQLRTIQSADVIHVLSDGHLAESGTWDDLIAKNSLLKNMWVQQLGNPNHTNHASENLIGKI